MAAKLQRVVQALRRLAGGGPANTDADGALLARFVAGDQAGFTALVQRHGGLVWNVCRRVLADAHAAEDAFQATFVVLLRRAKQLEGSGSLAGWLHAVALRTALRARADASRRRQREALVPEPDMTMRPSEADWQQLRPVLDEELAKLPAKYRQPIVLCYLEGKTNDEAAAQLGWTRGTVAGRLSRARDLLRARLGRRNITLASAALAALLTEQAQGAPVPTGLLEAAAGLVTHVPEPVNVLAKGVLSTMYQERLKSVALYVAAAVVAACLAGAVYTAVVPVEEKKPAKLDGGKPVNGLQLKLSPVKTATTTLKPDGKNAVGLELMLTLTNVSDKPIKLDTYDMAWQLSVTGPSDGSVQTARALADVLRRPPQASDYPTLQPGKSWQQSFTMPGSFSNKADEFTIYSFLKQGDYRIQAVFSHPKVTNLELARGSWTGVAESNPLVITVK